MKQKLKICSPQLGLSKNSNLGGEIHDAFLLEMLAKKGVKIYTVLPKGKDYPKNKNIVVESLPLKRIYPPFLFNFLILPKLFSLYQKHKFQILRIHSPYFIGPAAILFKKFFPKVKLIATYHHLEHGLILNFLDRIQIKTWDKIICVSQATKNDLAKKLSIGLQKISIIPNGLDSQIKSQKRDEILEKKFKLTGKIILEYLGQLSERKNIKFLIRVVEKLPSDNLLLIAGDGPLKNQLEFEVFQKNLKSRVIFTGYISRKEKIKYLNLADIFLYPSKKEGFGLTVIEAMACGKPVICSDIPAFREIIENKKNGFLLNTRDDKEWLSLIKKLAKSKTLRDKIGQRAQKVKEKFTWEKTALETIKVFKKII